jgi:hypothetical protein
MKPYANIRLTKRERKGLALAIRIRRRCQKAFRRSDAHTLAWVMFA